MTIKRSYVDENQSTGHQYPNGRPARQRTLECNYCYQKFAEKGNLLLHESIHKLNRHEPRAGREHACKCCKQHFRSKIALKKHSCPQKSDATGKHVLKERQQLFECPRCQKLFLTQANLYNHKMVHVSELPFQCEVCGLRFADKTATDEHTATHWGEKIVGCPLCPKKFKMDHALQSHERVHRWVESLEQHRPFDTADATLIFQSVESDTDTSDEDLNLVVAMEAVFEIEPSENIDECQKDETEEREDKDEVDEEMECSMASNKELMEKKSVDVSKSVTTKDSSKECSKSKKSPLFKCDECQTEFKWRRSWLRHQVTHSTLRPYGCRYCDQAFKRADHRNVHERTQHAKNSKQPRSSGKKMSTNSQKNDSLESDDKDCSMTIDKEPVTKVSFEVSDTAAKKDSIEEISQPKKKKRFECDECKKVFGFLSGYKRHQLSHSDLRPFECRYCETKFKRANHRTDHERKQHSSIYVPDREEKTDSSNECSRLERSTRFGCDKCDKKFEFLSEYKRHQLSHSTEQPFKCNYCESRFKRAGHKLDHERSKHPTKNVKK